MFTQCPKCETVFRLSADALRAAGGQVRCGRCGDVFNALARLAETATAFTKGESSLDLEARADRILHAIEAVTPVETMAPHGPEIAHLEIIGPLDEDLAGEASLEFTLPPGDLDRIFIETSPAVLQLLAADPVAAVEPVAAADPADATAATLAQTRPASADSVQSSPAVRRSGLEVSENVRQEMLASYQHAELPAINPPRRRLPRVAWIAAAVVLALLLTWQVILDKGDWLAAHAPPLLGGTSAAHLSAYQLRQWGVTGDPEAKGTLRIRASIMNTAPQMQPYPLLRVTLANRFGTRIGQREFEPMEYLGKPMIHMLAPGERADATLDVLDPGKDAEAFEIDVCIRGANAKVMCASDVGAADASARSGS